MTHPVANTILERRRLILERHRLTQATFPEDGVMTPTQFSLALERLGWSQRHLADLLGCDTNLPTRWARGEASVPTPLGLWLHNLAVHHVLNPVPTDWRQR